MKLPVYLLVAVFFFQSILLFSQTCDSAAAKCVCASDDLSPVGIMLGHEHPKGSWKFSYRYMSMLMDGNLSGTKKVDDNFVFNKYLMSPQNMRMDMHMIMAMYGITNRLSVMVMLNYNTMSMNMTMFPSTSMIMNGTSMIMKSNTSMTMNSKTAGLGDTKLYAVYSVINHDVHHILLNAGLSIPTGNIQIKGKSDDMMYPSQRLPYMMQLGSGTYDFMPGVTYLVKFKKASFSTQFTTVIRPFNNLLNYHLGNEYTLNVWGAYKWFPWVSSSVRVNASSVGAITGYDPTLYAYNEPSANPMNYGGKIVNTYVGLNFYLNRGWLNNNRLSVEYGMPVYQNPNGVQLASKSTIYAGWLFTF